MNWNQPKLPLLHENIVKANIYTVMSYIVNKDGTSLITINKSSKNNILKNMVTHSYLF